jgi:hypothetical protein
VTLSSTKVHVQELLSVVLGMQGCQARHLNRLNLAILLHQFLSPQTLKQLRVQTTRFVHAMAMAQIISTQTVQAQPCFPLVHPVHPVVLQHHVCH